MCPSPQVLKGDNLSSLSRGHVRWWALAQDAGPCAALALRQRRLAAHSNAHNWLITEKSSVMPLVVPVCGGCPHCGTPQEGVLVP